MGQHDIRTLFKQEKNLVKATMPEGHEARFLSKLEKTFPKKQTPKQRYNWWYLAASVVVFLGLGLGAYDFFQSPPTDMQESSEIEMSNLKTLGDVSPGLKKVEDYYLANINMELANVQVTSGNKALFDGYLERLEELNVEYKRLSVELTENGPNELTVTALIDNLRLRLNLLYRLKAQLQELNDSENNQKTI